MGSLRRGQDWITDIFDREGPISEGLSTYERRDQQIDMAKAVEEALSEGDDLFVEAGTGTGKSLAYLVPLLSYAQERGTSVITSTHTKHLQEQIARRDFDLASRAFDEPLESALVKGRRNYLCTSRLQQVKGNQETLFAKNEDQRLINEIAEWAEREAVNGTRSEIPFSVPSHIWTQINSKRGFCSCLRKESESSLPCFYRSNRIRVQSADFIVANHHLVMFDLVMRSREDLEGVFPEYDAIVFDEAQHVVRTAQRCLGRKVGYWELKFLLNQLYNSDDDSGFLRQFDAPELRKDILRKEDQVDQFFSTIRNWLEQRGSQRGRSVRISEPYFVRNTLSPVLRELAEALERFRKSTELDGQQEQELTAYSVRFREISDNLEFLISQKQPEDVYWLNEVEDRNEITLKHSPISIASEFQELVLEENRSVVFTSATLSASPDRPFQYMKGRLGAEEARSKKLGSPFEYSEQVELHIPRDMPHPGREQDRYLKGIRYYTMRYLEKTSGDAFVLFTSYHMLDQVCSTLREKLEAKGMAVLSQAGNIPRRQLIQEFKRRDSAVLFGVSSFWEGVDVPGDSLRNVIITKLPFPVPSEPLNEAIGEYLEKQGKNPFSEFALPRAILRLRQGFGRLIRSKTDHGLVSILDSRIVRKSYGKQFLRALPDCSVHYDRWDD